jgi:hypothetical protein
MLPPGSQHRSPLPWPSRPLIVHPHQLVWVGVGDRAKVEPGLKELKMGEIELLNPDGKPSSVVSSRASATSKPTAQF